MTIYKKFFRNLFLNPCVATTFTVMVLLFFLMEMLSWNATNQIKLAVKDVLSTHTKASFEANNLRVNVYRLRLYEQDLFFSIGDKTMTSAYEKLWREALRDFSSTTLTLIAMSDDTVGVVGHQKKIEEIQDIRAYTFGFNKVLAGIRNGSITDCMQARKAIAPYKTVAYEVDEKVVSYITLVNASRDRAGQAVDELITRLQFLAVVMAGGISLLIVVLTSVIIQSIIRYESSAIKYGRRKEDRILVEIAPPAEEDHDTTA